MASITIRKLDDELKQRLRVRAAEHGHSMEQEARDILRAALAQPETGAELVRRIRARFEEVGYIEPGELKIPPRAPGGESPRTGEEWYRAIRALVEPIGGIELGELEMPPRGPMREPPQFD